MHTKKFPTPSREELRAAEGKKLPDVLAPGLAILFCGINPGLYSAAVGHHFARPGNRFWKTLFRAGITPRLLSPYEDLTLPRYGCGITNLAARATARAEELSAEELKAGRRALARKVRRYKPRALAVLGMSAFACAFERPVAGAGPRPETMDGTALWVLPNPSGLNANYQLDALVRLFTALREAVRR